jgi:glycosyltransferase involved in cell wall biosynthesis
MEILWLAHRDPLNPRAGGAERTILEVCTRLVRKGYKVTLLTGGGKGCKRIENLRGIEIRRFGRVVALHLILPVFLLKYHYDIVVDDLGHAVPWITPVILNKNNIVFFRHLHARSLPGQVSPLLAKIITVLEKCYFIIYHDAIFITESTTSKNDLLRLGIKEKKITMNPPGVDLNLFHPAKKTEYPSFVYFGGMRKYKRPHETLFLLKNLLEKMNNIRLFVVGSGPEEVNMKKVAFDLGVQENVIFKGRISDAELSDTVASAWLNVHTSVTEGWGYSILEASAAGTPTVAYNVPGVKDAIEDGLNGIKVKDGDRKGFLNATLSILSDPERWWLSSVEVAKKYSWDITADLWEKLIQETFDDHSR